MAEQLEVKTGPTTIDALGNHYQQQLKKQKLADLKMKVRAERVADVIQAPTLKDAAADVMIKANPIINDANALKEEEVRQLKIKEASLDNMTRHHLQQVEQRKNNYEL